MALQTPPSGLSSTQIQFQGQKQTDKQVSQTGHCRSARKVFAVGRLEKIFLKIISRYIKELRATQTHFFLLFFLSLLSFREGNLAERNRHVAVCNYIFFFFFASIDRNAERDVLHGADSSRGNFDKEKNVLCRGTFSEECNSRS